MLFTYLLIPLLFLFSPEKEKAPPGTILVGKYYVDYQEMTNIDWLVFEFETGRQGNVNRTTKPMYNFDYNHPDHRDLPITNITFEQATMYCKWRSKVVSKVAKRKITYRLPTQEEWLEIARELIKRYPVQMEDEFRAAKLSTPGIMFMKTSVKLGYPVRFFCGLSEMTSTPGVALGSSDANLTTLNDNLTHAYTYNEYSEFVGFRCIAEVEEKKAKQRK